MDRLKKHIRNIPDFPKPGVQFKDITPLLKNPHMSKLAIHHLVQPFLGKGITVVASMEARGFIFGSLAALSLGVGFIPLRKPGKLPYKVKSSSYELEYGSETLEVHVDAFEKDARVLLVDDVLATGGTAKASCKLIEDLGVKVSACAFIIELDFLKGREKISKYNIHSLLHY